MWIAVDRSLGGDGHAFCRETFREASTRMQDVYARTDRLRAA